jgi:uncharacterized protein (TIRG00374 family)
LNKKILNILKYTAFTALGVLLFWLVYRGQDFKKIWHTLEHDVNYWWVGLSLFFGLLSHISRTLRWKIALEPLGYKPSTTNTFITVMMGYFMNLLLPRMGEFVRCGTLSKYEKIPLSKLLGTVVTERIIDVIMLMLLTFFVFVLQLDKVKQFAEANPEVVSNIQKIISNPILWIGLVVVIVAFILYLKLSKGKDGTNAITRIIHEFAEGIKSVFAMKRYKAYIFHTFFIWLMYFAMLYVVFFSFDFTSHLKPITAITTFTAGTYGMVAPVQGGIGAWHFMVQKALEIYGIAPENGKIFALLAHTSMNVMIIILGVICIIALPIVNRNKNIKQETQTTTE